MKTKHPPKAQPSAAKKTVPPAGQSPPSAGMTKPSLSVPAAALVPAEKVPCTLPIAQLKPSPSNPRIIYGEGALRALADSIRQVGVLERLVVRPVPEKGKEIFCRANEWFGVAYFEIVAGHRRHRAAKLAGLDKVPVDVVILSDEAVEVIHLVENDQREDLCLSEQAYAYLKMSRSKTAEEMAALLGRPVSTIRSVLRIARLPVEVLRAVDDGKLPRAVAELVARVPGDETRAAVAAHVLAGQEWVRKGEKPPKPAADAEPLTYRATRQMIGEHFQVQLKGAPFNRKALDLIPAAKDCEGCPKRAGNDPDATADGVRADVCLDPGCYRQKVDAHNARALDAAKQSGRKLLSKGDAAGLFQSWNQDLQYGAPYVDLDGPCHDDPKHRTYRQLLKSHAPAEDVVIAVDHSGSPRELFDICAARSLIKKHHGIGRAGSSRSKEDANEKKRQADRDRRAKLGKNAAALANRMVAERAEREFSACPGHAASVPQLQQLACAAAEIACSDACRAVSRRRGQSGDPHDAVRALALELLNPGDLIGLIAELIAARLSIHWGRHWSASGEMHPNEVSFWSAFGVDREKLIADIECGKPVLKLAKSAQSPEVKHTPPAEVGSLALVDVPKFPPAAAAHLGEVHQVWTLKDFSPHFDQKLAKKSGRPIYAALESLGLTPPLLYTAGDSLVDHLEPGTLRPLDRTAGVTPKKGGGKS